MTTAFETFDRICLPVLRQMDGFQSDEYSLRRQEAESIMPLLQEHLHDLASTQIGFPPDDLPRDSNVVRFSFFNRWRRHYAKLSGDDKGILLQLFKDLVELGCAFHLLWCWRPEHLRDLNALPPTGIREEWFEEAYAADIIMKPFDEEVYGGSASFLADQYVDQEVIPFYRSRRLGGFMGWNYGKFSGHAKMLYYAGMRLGVRFDVIPGQNAC